MSVANIVVAVKDKNFSERKLAELIALCRAVEISVDDIVTQAGEHSHPLSYLQKGKAAQLFQSLDDQDTLIFNDELTGLQYNYITAQCGAQILDRTSLILTIFAQRARTREARLQVEIARLSYTLPRLKGSHQDLTGQMGGSGFRGSGETELELERRQINRKLAQLKRELKQLVQVRKTQRRQRQNVPVVALVGYTNSGKSTLLNQLVKNKQVLAKDMLFATLETSTRKVASADGRPFLITDTVGFMHDLPHTLIEAFKSTLEEISEANLLLMVIDATDPDYAGQIATTREVLKEIGVTDTPVIYLYNKTDLETCDLLVYEEPHLLISAKTGDHLDRLIAMIKKYLYPDTLRMRLFIPYEEGPDYAYLASHSQIIHCDYQERGMYIVADMASDLSGRYQRYVLLN